ncbi:MAG: prolyl oligopeptidase family serine peptidase [Verrucomicrobiota bacterium]|jgi:prolyl oligopeptidase
MTARSRSKFHGRTALPLALVLLAALLSARAANETNAAANTADPYLWLEEVTGLRALDWVERQNAVSTNQLEASPDFEATRQRLLLILNSNERIPLVEKQGTFYYNFWRDDRNPRGLFRRTTLEEYKKANPAWETVIDLDKLAGDEKENWVWESYHVLKPGYERCMVMLSRGGADAVVVREFDLNGKRFVPDGFFLPEAKSEVAWRDKDTLYVGSDFGPGSLTTSGYPRLIKEWKRGTPLSQAPEVFAGKREDVAVGVIVEHDHGQVYEFIRRALTFYSDETWLRRSNGWTRIEKPDDARLRTFGEYILLQLRSDWLAGGKVYAGGSLLLDRLDAYLGGDRHFTILYAPGERTALQSISATRNYLVLNELDNVRSRAHLWRRSEGQWTQTPLEAPALGTASAQGIDPDESDAYFMNVAGFLTPSSLFLGAAGQSGSEKIKSLPDYFKTAGLEVTQHEAKSADGTRIPYFEVIRQGLHLDGKNVTLLTGYGGFESAMLPSYRPTVGAAWLERGGVYVLANIRGGGEFGPAWHNAAVKENRQRAYDDFIAVAEDLIARGVTSPAHLGIEGRSNGGLLMGVMLTERPELFGAVHCGSPLLDMRRYNKLLAGASWMGEYGDPDQAKDWQYIQKYSPYQNARPDRKYPPILITTSTRDDRVHPGHARKMAARLEEMGHQVLFYENTEGGHGAAANNRQTAFMETLAYTFLWNELKVPADAGR